MTRGLAAALVVLAAPVLAGGGDHASAAAAKHSGRHAKQSSHSCRAHARCATVRRAKRRPSARPLERLLGVGPGPAPAPAPAPGQPESPAPGAPTLPRFVSVAAREFSLTLSRPLVGAGTVTIELRNSGEDPHNLVISPEGTHPLASFSQIDPGTYERRSVHLAVGRYRLWCSLESHEDLGMSTTLKVE